MHSRAETVKSLNQKNKYKASDGRVSKPVFIHLPFQLSRYVKQSNTIMSNKPEHRKGLAGSAD